MRHWGIRLGIVGGMWVWAVVGAAQQMPPDQVFFPLVVRAEADLSAGDPRMAHARADAVLRFVQPDTPAGQRARAVVASAQPRVPRGAPAPTADEIYEPLVSTAESEAASGQNAVAAARLTAVLQILPADSALATRARNVYALATRGGGGGQMPPPPGGGTPPPPGYGTPPPPGGGYGQQPPPGGYGQQPPPGGYGAPPPPGAYAPPVAPVPPVTIDPERRGGREMVELYVTEITFGVYAGAYLAYLMGGDDETLLGTLPILGGLGAGLTVWALDAEPGMRAGVPSAISTGTWLGFFDGLLAYAAFQSDFETCTPSGGCSANDDAILSLLFTSTVLGTAVGAGVGYGMRPTVGDNRLVLSGGIWGAWLMGMLALASQPDSSETAWQMVFVGYNVGIAASILATAAVDMTEGRVWLLNLGLILGAMAGAIVPAMIVGGRDDREVDEPVVAATVGVGSAAGLILALILTGNRDQAAPPPPPPGAPTEVGVQVTAGVAPIEGGAMIRGAVTF